MANDQAALDASLTTLIADIGTLTTAVKANSDAIAALVAKIGTSPAAPDFTNELAQVAQADQAVKDAVAAITAADAPPAA